MRIQTVTRRLQFKFSAFFCFFFSRIHYHHHHFLSVIMIAIISNDFRSSLVSHCLDVIQKRQIIDVDIKGVIFVDFFFFLQTFLSIPTSLISLGMCVSWSILHVLLG